MHSFQQNLRFAVRQLLKTPGMAIVCVLTLALGIGANTAVFSVMNAVLLRSLPVADPSRVFYLYTTGMPNGGTNTGSDDTSFSYPVYQALSQESMVFSQVIAYVPLSLNKIAVRIGSQPEEAEADMVSGNFFTGLGVRMEQGRGFSAQDETSHAPIIVISHNYWSRRFSLDPGVIGKNVVVKGVPMTVVGVSAAGFEGVEAGSSTDMWIPLQDRPELNAWSMTPVDGKLYMERQNWWCLRMLARLAPGVSKAQAVGKVQGIFAAAAYVGIGTPAKDEKPPILSLHDAKNFPGSDQYYGQPLQVLMSMVGLVLLIALSNVAMLLVARNTMRQREFSLRLALGAGRGQLFRQLLTESALLVTSGGILAWVFAVMATKALAAWSSIETTLAPDRTVLLFTLGILVLAAMVFGLVPLKSALESGPALVLKTSSVTANTDKNKARSSRIVVAVQMALCLTLLAGAGLLVRTLHNLQTLPLGMNTDGLVVFGLNPQTTHSKAETVAFYNRLIVRLRAMPGIRNVTAMENRIGSGWSNNNNVPPIDGAKPIRDGSLRNNSVGPDFFHTLGVPILAGRDFTDADNASAPVVVIVNETFAKTYMDGRNPVGHHVGDGKNIALIVGLVKDNKYTSITEEPTPMLWVPYMQTDGGVGEEHIELRVAAQPGGDPMAILPAVRRVVAEIDPNLPLQQPMTQRAQFEVSISQQQLFARLAGFFGLIAVVLVATGLYGTMAYRVSNRTMEIGVRMALGAKREQVVWMIVRESLILAAVGVVLGVPLVILVSRLLRSQLFGVQPYDAVSYSVAVAGVAAVAMIATLIPAQRAASVDPVRALRSE